MKKNNLFISVATAISLTLLYLPSLAVAVFSVNNAKMGLVWKGLTFKWYLKLFENELIQEAALNSLYLALISTIIATVIGTFLALGLDRFPWGKKIYKFLDLLVHFPVVVPDIILAASLVLAFSFLRIIWQSFEMGMLTLILGHITFQISFVALVVRSRLTVISKDIDEAAKDLYASNSYLFRKITFPLLLPGVIAGAMMAFTLSLDDFVISFFTHGPDSVTLPIYIYSSIRRGISPEIHALSTLILMITILLVFIAERFSRKFN